MMEEAASEALYQHWVHSHEEDTATEKVFRPAGYPFPPSRGRFSFELKRDGALVIHGIAPADGAHSVPGVWSREGSRLLLRPSVIPGQEQKLDIISIVPDRMVVRQ
jgi:hypothetical protein